MTFCFSTDADLVCFSMSSFDDSSISIPTSGIFPTKNSLNFKINSDMSNTNITPMRSSNDILYNIHKYITEKKEENGTNNEQNRKSRTSQPIRSQTCVERNKNTIISTETPKFSTINLNPLNTKTTQINSSIILQPLIAQRGKNTGGRTSA